MSKDMNTCTPLPYGVLIIEDCKSEMQLMVEAMRVTGFDKLSTVHCAYDAGQAFEILDSMSQNGTALDLIILDLNIPKFSGKQILERLMSQALYKYIPVFIVSNSDNKKDINDCFSLGASGYAQKPMNFFRLIKLLDSIRNSLERHGMILPLEIQKEYGWLETRLA